MTSPASPGTTRALNGFVAGPVARSAPVAYAFVLLLLDPEREKQPSPEPAGLPWSPGGRISRREMIGGGFFLLASAVLVRTAIGKLPSRPGINPEGLPEPITPSKSFY